VGKGVQGPGRHEERSVELAKGVLNRLGLSADDREVVLFLISRHLDMSYTAQQRDLDDLKVIQRFAELVKNEQYLKRLYLLTFADMRAVSSLVWNGWNAILLWQLYTRTLKFLQGKIAPKLDELQARVIQLIGNIVGRTAIEQHFERMPEGGLISQLPESISKQIQLVQQLGDAPITVSCFEADATHTQLGICTRDARGIFRRITGVLAAENINILSAVINTRSDGIVIDVLTVADGGPGKQGISTAQCRQIAETLTAVWKGETDVETLLRQRSQISLPAYMQRRISPPEIHINNDESERATIIDIRAGDRVGLLYTISNTFYELGLDIRLAKITTEAYTAVDSFYVTEENGEKITDAAQIEEIKATLEKSLQLEG
jgi:[protein-PII] uridylyltransferase